MTRINAPLFTYLLLQKYVELSNRKQVTDEEVDRWAREHQLLPVPTDNASELDLTLWYRRLAQAHPNPAVRETVDQVVSLLPGRPAEERALLLNGAYYFFRLYPFTATRSY